MIGSERMRMMTAAATFGAMFLSFVQPAQARSDHQGWRAATDVAHHSAGSRAYAFASAYATSATGHASAYQRGAGYGYDARPAAWCGWEMRRLVSADPGPEYNLARNWAHWGHPGPAGVGAVVVWSHHVGKIVGREDGMWVIESGNDDHATRTRPRSISGAIAVRWG
jgi:hypothetical protein